MTGVPARGTGRRRRSRWRLISVGLALIAAGSLVLGFVGHQVDLSGPAGSRFALPSASGSANPTSGVAVPEDVRSAPVALQIRAIGIAVSVSALGLNSDGTVQVPSDFQKPGWFQPGPSPGQLGSAVILGHVDSKQGPAIFFRLRSLLAGDIVEVTLADGTIDRFVVRAVVSYPKAQFPDRQVYASHGDRALQLITCGGVFDTSTRSYLSNVVVFTTLVPSAPPASVSASPARFR
jgi:Sortase domain